jgi:hypothetical protein
LSTSIDGFKKKMKFSSFHFCSSCGTQATPRGQAVFDRLLKACGEVVWKGNTSILVLNQIQVDEPYTAENCRIVRSNGGKNGGGLEDGSLDRVKKIVTATAAELSNNTTT